MEKNRKLRVLFVSNMKDFSGGEIVLERIIRYNQRIESEVFLPEGAFARQLAQQGTQVHTTQRIRKLFRESRKVAWLALLWNTLLGNIEIARLVKQRKIDILVANSFGLFAYCALSKLLSTKVVLIHYHPIFAPGTFDFKLARHAARTFNAIVCVSDAVKTSYLQAGAPANKLVTIRNGLDHQTLPTTEGIAPAVRQAHGVMHDTISLGLVATITSWKGHETLVQAVKFAKQHSATRPFKCFIIGGILNQNEADQRFAKLLRQTIAQEDLNDVITFTGQLDFPTIYALLDVVLNCSVVPEPLGTTIYEGMAMRKVVVATAIGGSSEILEDNVSGYLVPPGNAVALGEKIIAIINNYDQLTSLREAAYRQSLERFSVKGTVDRYNQLFFRLAHEKY